MWKNENNDAVPQHMTDALTAYEEAVAEFSTSATEFLKHIPLLTKAQDAYQRASTASTQLREVLDKGDETLRNFMAKMQQTVNYALDAATPDGTKPEAVNVESIEMIGEKGNAARA